MAKSKTSSDDTEETITENRENPSPTDAEAAQAKTDDTKPPIAGSATPNNTEPAAGPSLTNPADGQVADPQLQAEGTRAASVITPNAPPPPTDSLPSVEEQRALDEQAAADANARAEADEADKPEDGIHPESGIDARLHMALDLAKRALSFGLINDLSKAVLLILDIHSTPEPHASPVAVAAARGEEPALL